MNIDDLEALIASFERDPPDTDFQRGYLAALEEIWRQAQEPPLAHERQVLQ